MGQDLNKGNLYQAAKKANLTQGQMTTLNALTSMYSTHSRLSNMPINVAQSEFNQLTPEQQKAMAAYFGGEQDDTNPNRGIIGQAFYIASRPVVEPIKAVFKAASWASDQVTRVYRAGTIATQEQINIADAWRRSGASGEMVFNPDRIERVKKEYGADRLWVAQQISAGIPLDQIIRTAQNENQKALAFSAGSEEGDQLTNEAVAKVNASKYSAGRDLANALLPEDLEGGRLYRWISGTTDAAFRLFLDPTLILGKARKGYLATKYALDKTVGSADKVDFAFQNRGVVRFWDEFANTTKQLRDARRSGSGEGVAAAATKLRRLNPAFVDNGVDSELIKFADDDFGGVIDIDTVKAFLQTPGKVEPLFYGQPGFTTKVMPILSPLRKKRIDALTAAGKTFNLNDESANFLRNIVFDEADYKGITSLEAARRSIMGAEGEDAIAAGARTAERILKAEQPRKFSIAWANNRLDNFTRKFTLIPDMGLLGDFANDKSAKAFGQYARLVYGRYASRILEDAYKTGNVAQRREMFIGLQSAVGELRGLRGTAGGRRLLETLGSVGRDAVYTNRVFDADHPDGFIPSKVGGMDSAAYVYQLKDRLAFITPDQLDKFGARDGFLSKIWGAQYTQAADDAVSVFVTGTLAGPRFPVRNAIEDYLFYLANGRGVIRSARDIARGRKLAKKTIQASEDLNFALFNRYSKAKDVDNLVARMNAIDNGAELRWNAGAKTWDRIDDVFKSPAEKDLAKRKVFAESLLRDKFNDAQIGKFGDDFDRFTYEFAMYGDFENLLRAASEGAYNFNAGNDFFSRVGKSVRRKGKTIDFTIDGEDYARQYGSFVSLDPLDQEGRLAWAFQIVAKANDEIGSQGMRLMRKYSDLPAEQRRAAVIRELSDYLDNDVLPKYKDRFDRYIDPNYKSISHAGTVYDDLTVMLGKADGSLNTDLLGKLVRLDDVGESVIDLKNFSTDWLPRSAADVPRSIQGPRFIPAQQSGNIISDLNTRLWDWLGDANARLSRDQIVMDAAFNIRKDLQGYLDDLKRVLPEEEATRRVVELSNDLAVERVLAFVDNPAVRTQMAWSMRNFARFYRATEDAYRRAYRTIKYNPEQLQKFALTYEGVTHSGFIQKDDQGDAYFVYPGLAPVYGAVNKVLGVFGLEDKFVAPMPLQFGSSLRMLTPSANPDSWLPTFSGPISGLSLKLIYNAAGLFSESDIPIVGGIGKEIKSTERMALGEIGESQSFWQSVLPGHVNRFLASVDKDERDSQYASAFRKAVTYLEAGGHTPSATATPGELVAYQKKLRASITGILTTRFVLGFISPAAPTTQLKSDMADWVRDNGRVNFKQVFSKLIDQYSDTTDPVGNAMRDWTRYYPDQVPYTLNESDPIFQARVKTSNAAANWVQDNKDLVKEFPEGAAFLMPQAGTFTWDAYEFLKDNGYRENKLVGDYLKEVFVARDKQFYYSEQDRYEAELAKASTDRERKRVNEIWSEWSRQYRQTRPLLQQDFAEAAVNQPKRQNAYTDLKKLIGSGKVNNQATRTISQMIGLYEDYLLQIDTVYNSMSETDIRARSVLRETTLRQLEDLALTNPNAKGVYDVLFYNFLGRN
jgi:flagella basal body P-ring formation protein FlgA